jgi:hypothetical protein
MSDTSPRVLPRPWTLTATDLAKLCHKPVDPAVVNASRDGDPALIEDVEGLCRGALADAQRRGVLSREIETRDWQEVLGYLLGQVVARARSFDPGRRGIEFRPWLYDHLRYHDTADACRWLYGRSGQHRVNGGFHASDFDEEDWNIDQPDPCDDSREARLEHALSGGSVDGPEHRLDALFGLYARDHRGALRRIPGLGEQANRKPAPSDPGADDNDLEEAVA